MSIKHLLDEAYKIHKRQNKTWKSKLIQSQKDYNVLSQASKKRIKILENLLFRSWPHIKNSRLELLIKEVADAIGEEPEDFWVNSRK